MKNMKSMQNAEKMETVENGMDMENPEMTLSEKMMKKNVSAMTEQELSQVIGGDGGQTFGVPLDHFFVDGVCAKCKITYGAYAASGWSIRCM